MIPFKLMNEPATIMNMKNNVSDMKVYSVSWEEYECYMFEVLKILRKKKSYAINYSVISKGIMGT